MKLRKILTLVLCMLVMACTNVLTSCGNNIEEGWMQSHRDHNYSGDKLVVTLDEVVQTQVKEAAITSHRTDKTDIINPETGKLSGALYHYQSRITLKGFPKKKDTSEFTIERNSNDEFYAGRTMVAGEEYEYEVAFTGGETDPWEMQGLTIHFTTIQ